ncbi:MAG: flagellar M-ring protein FliF C-terminal domain-containing protein [Lacunisphaera sp.]
MSAEIDTESTSITAEKFDPEGQVVRSQTSTEDTNNTTETRSGGGAVGVSANVPEKAAATDAVTSRPVSNSEQNRKNRTTTYEINRTLTNTTRNPGTIKNVTAAVLVAQRPPLPVAVDAKPAEGTAPAAPSPRVRTADELNALRQVVVNALGLKPEAGQSLDTIVTLQEVPFAAEPVTEQIQAIQKENRWQGWIEAASRWSAVAGAGLVLLVFLRVLSKQKPEAVPVEVLAMPPELAARSLQNGTTVTPEMLNELIKQKPANIGTALRDWVGTPAPSTKN